MKKNIFSDNKKGSKGFYAALGISAVMVGSACCFAYKQGEKLTKELSAGSSISEHESPVDNKVTNIPKKPPVTAVKSTTATKPVLTAATITALPQSVTATIPAAAVESVEEAENISANEPPENEILNVNITKMENVKAPLDDISDVIEVFSGKELVKSRTTGSWQTHNGTDIAAEVGSNVYAVSNGEVMDIKNDPVWGVSVTIDHHNGFESKYCSLSPELSVQKGDMVVSGDIIGVVGNTADIESSLPPHLHIEVTKNGDFIDPLSTLRD